MKENKKSFIIITIILIALAVCISINFTIKKNKHINDDNVINIECDGENCDKEVVPKDDQNDNTQKDDNSSNNSNKSINGNASIKGKTDKNNNSADSTDSADNSSEETIPDNKGELTIGDKDQVWTNDKELKIFNIKEIAPGDSGNYDFYVNNNTDSNVMYKIVFAEDNLYNVNLLYKLKRNGKYISGSESEWVKYDKLNIENKVLNSKYNDYYAIEWKWVDTDNDTRVGRTPDAKYRLKVTVKAAETEEFDKSASASFSPYTGDKILLYIELALLSAIILILIIIKRRQKD